MMANVFVIHGANDGHFPLVGHTVLAAKISLREAFNIPYFAEATINGEIVPLDYHLRNGDTLTFAQRFGFKGGDELDRPERDAEGLLRIYPGLRKIAEEVKASGIDGPEAIDLMARRVAEWCLDKFGPLEERITATLERLVEKMQKASQASNPDEITDGPTDFGELWYKGEFFDLGLTALEVRLVRALWKIRRRDTESVCEEVYGSDDLNYNGIKDVKKRVNAKFKGKCPLYVKKEGEALYLIETDAAGG